MKEELFDKVKFLYNQTVKLRVGGLLYSKFVKDCKDRLFGLKSLAGDTKSQQIYLKLLWTAANGKTRNMIAMGLTTKRSTVFSSMQNHFIGKLDERCPKNNLQ